MKKRIGIAVNHMRQTACALIAAVCALYAVEASGLTAEQQKLADELANVDPATGSFIYGEVNFERNGVQAVSAEMTGLDNTPNTREWNITFLTDFSTYGIGLWLFVR